MLVLKLNFYKICPMQPSYIYKIFLNHEDDVDPVDGVLGPLAAIGAICWRVTKIRGKPKLLSGEKPEPEEPCWLEKHAILGHAIVLRRWSVQRSIDGSVHFLSIVTQQQQRNGGMGEIGCCDYNLFNSIFGPERSVKLWILHNIL